MHKAAFWSVVSMSITLWAASSGGTLHAATILYLPVDIPDSTPVEDVWEYQYFATGFGFVANQGFSVSFDRALYRDLQDPPPVHPHWDVLVLQPDPAIPDDGLYDALALASPASLVNPFRVRFTFLGTGVPGPQPFTIHEFDNQGNLQAVLASGMTQPVPEPSPAWLIPAGIFACVLLHNRLRRRMFLCGLLVIYSAHLSPLAAQTGGVTVELIRMNLVASERELRSEFTYTYSLEIRNVGDGYAAGVAASVRSSSSSTVVVDGAAYCGNIAAGQTVTCSDTIAVRHDRRVPFEVSALTFQFGLETSKLPPMMPGERVIAGHTTVLPIMDRTVARLKILDQVSGRIREAAVDVQGTPVDYEQLRLQSRALWRQHHGAAAPDVIEAVTKAPASIFLVDIEAASRHEVDTVRRELASVGMSVVSTHDRVIAASGTADAIRRAARLPRVTAVLFHQERLPLALAIARDLDHGAVAGAHTQGVGTGLTIAVWEVQGCINRAFPDFASVTFLPRLDASPCVLEVGGWHSSAVAGVLAADRGNRGTAGLFRGRMFDVDATSFAAEDDMWARKPHIVNASWTISRFEARRADAAAYDYGVFFFNASGNDGPAETYCRSYNGLCVGGYVDAATIGFYQDDTVWVGSSFINDEYNGRENPQVLGPVTARETATPFFYYQSVTGTSFAAPGVAGLVGLLLAHQPFLLFGRPAAMRAVLMASAQAHPIIDQGRRIPDINDGVDDRMGVGAPNGLRARSILDDRTLVFRRITPQTLGTQASFPVGKDERVRVVLTWDQCPDYEVNDPRLKVDLDLSVRAPNHLGFPSPRTISHTNTSFSDNWETVEFISRVAGMIDVVVSASRFGTCPADGGLTQAPMAIAWTKEAAPPVVTPASTQTGQ